MNPIELLRFDWSRVQQRLLLAALCDFGPVSAHTWAVRAGIPRNHVLPVVAECERLGGLRRECRAEGLCLFVQPAAFWRVTPLAEAGAFAAAWGGGSGAVQERMAVATEMPGLDEALAVADTSHRTSPLEAEREKAAGVFSLPAPNRIPVAQPDSGSPLLNVKRFNDLNEVAFNVERSKGAGIRCDRSGWVEPQTEAEAMEACRRLLGETDMRVWGGRWRNRWRSNPEGLRKVLNMVREDQATGRQPVKGSSWGRFASHLWSKFVEPSEVKA